MADDTPRLAVLSELEKKWNFDFMGSWFMLERHKHCGCSYCCRSPFDGWPLMKPGINLPECKSCNSWVVVHWRWRGSKWYFRFTLGFFGERQ
jgi:hypothetical protein